MQDIGTSDAQGILEIKVIVRTYRKEGAIEEVDPTVTNFRGADIDPNNNCISKIRQATKRASQRNQINTPDSCFGSPGSRPNFTMAAAVAYLVELVEIFRSCSSIGSSVGFRKIGQRITVQTSAV